MPAFFPLLLVNARPGAGKTEILHALQEIPETERIERFHVGPMHVLDDFPMLWAWFEEDRILETVFQRPRLHTTPDEYFLHPDLWHVLIRRLCLEYEKFVRDHPEPTTVVLEFSRGAPHGGYQAAYQHLTPLILQQAVAVYVRVSYAESSRKNATRFNPDRPDSLLEHGLSPEKLERLYREDDWATFTAQDPAYLRLAGNVRLPYAVFDNEDDVTTRGGPPLLERLEHTLGRLWEFHTQR